MKTYIHIEIPEWDEVNKRPASKMPDCPVCAKDELGMISKGYILCYGCGLSINLPQRAMADEAIEAFQKPYEDGYKDAANYFIEVLNKKLSELK
jgi:ribosomal protein L37AE/L43A